MAKDFSVETVKVGGVLNPTPKIGILVRYENGRKEDAINAVFDAFGGAQGVTVTVPEGGQSRRYLTPENFPTTNVWVNGGEARGLMFVKFEVIN